MIRKRWLSLALAVTMVAALLSGTVIVSAQGSGGRDGSDG